MYHRVRRKMKHLTLSAILVISHVTITLTKSIQITENTPSTTDLNIDNNIIDFDDEYSVRFDNDYSKRNFNKESHRYTIDKDVKKDASVVTDNNNEKNTKRTTDIETTTNEFNVIPLELISTTENVLQSILESTTEPDYSVIPLSSTVKEQLNIQINQTVSLPTSTESDSTTDFFPTELTESSTISVNLNKSIDTTTHINNITIKTSTISSKKILERNTKDKKYEKLTTEVPTTSREVLTTNSSRKIEITDIDSQELDLDLPIFTELDVEDAEEVPEDYYDSKDVVPTTAPKTDAISVLVGLAGSMVESVVESVAERVVPKGIFDLFKRMQKQNEALEAERLRSREENGGLGQFTRGILKTISTSLSKPLSQLMTGIKDIGSLDSDKGFVGSLASGVTSVATVATSVVDSFKDRVQAIYPGTVWCGDGHSASARSSDLGLFFFTDTCCRQHDACKLYIRAGETKYGLTNTGLFTRSHCSCDVKFRECLRRTNSLVSAQIGLTYFNVLGPQCFRRAHPIVKCVRRTRITGQKCEEYELDYTKPKMWQWFDNETF
ncbi:uncharacterized protein LOC128679810 isoform X2 [Plodia interpunctella]|nr:uncharacterized protein LOC128679810 isoform X2 [Plodia interpunctella]XP_053618242.1 uncharacterized protein LOC128679810 isoform X2 [Plodia interpunctella]